MIFNKYYYLFYKINVTNNPDAFRYFSGIPRQKRRFDFFNSVEIDYSGVGFENNTIILQFGRGKQSWGAGPNNFLILNSSSPSYDYGLLGLKLGRIKMKYFHGFLESVRKFDNNYNRYIYGRGIEWSNKKDIVVSLSEVGIYQGADRPVDFSFLNPLSNHIEIELNNRQNKLGNNQNAFWQFSLDKYFIQKLRFYFNFLIDELTLDKDNEEYKESHLLAFSGGLNFLIKKNNRYYFLVKSNLIAIGTHTYRHQYGMNNFVHRGMPLGSEMGSDLESFDFGFKVVNVMSDLFLDITYRFSQNGENNIIYNPYDPNHNTYKELFPSGEVKTAKSIIFKFEKWYNDSFGYVAKCIIENSKNIQNNSFVIEFFYSRPLSLKITDLLF